MPAPKPPSRTEAPGNGKKLEQIGIVHSANEGRGDSSTHRTHSPWLDALPTLIIAFASAYFVHRLTKNREWDKGVAERAKRIEEQVDAACEAACEGWTLRAGTKRAQSVATTKWRLQQIGQSAAALKRFAEHRRWTFGPYFLPSLKPVTIDVISDVSHLRAALTIDPFEDPKRPVDGQRLTDVALAKGKFLTALDTKWNAWAMPTRAT